MKPTRIHASVSSSPKVRRLCYHFAVSPVRLTNGFKSALELNLHFAKHAAELGLTTLKDYEDNADLFMGSPKPAHVLECVRKINQDTCRFNPLTDEYGVMNRKGIIKTYYKPVPCSSLGPTLVAILRPAGRCHPQANNLDYFMSGCT